MWIIFIGSIYTSSVGYTGRQFGSITLFIGLSWGVTINQRAFREGEFGGGQDF